MLAASRKVFTRFVTNHRKGWGFNRVGIGWETSDPVMSYLMFYPSNYNFNSCNVMSYNLTLALNAHINYLLPSRTKWPECICRNLMVLITNSDSTITLPEDSIFRFPNSLYCHLDFQIKAEHFLCRVSFSIRNRNMLSIWRLSWRGPHRLHTTLHIIFLLVLSSTVWALTIFYCCILQVIFHTVSLSVATCWQVKQQLALWEQVRRYGIHFMEL